MKARSLAATRTEMWMLCFGERIGAQLWHQLVLRDLGPRGHHSGCVGLRMQPDKCAPGQNEVRAVCR